MRPSGHEGAARDGAGFLRRSAGYACLAKECVRYATRQSLCISLARNRWLQLMKSAENFGSAVSMLEKASADKPLVDYPIAMSRAPFWMRDEMALAQLYRRMGRVQDAEKIENELRKLLAYADPDFPMLVELKRLQNAARPIRKPN